MATLNKKIKIIVISITLLLLIQSPIIALNNDKSIGFDKGPSYLPVAALKKVTLINYDEESHLDDYAYLASVPSAVFKDQKNDLLYSHPLIFYQDKMDIDNETEKSLDPYKGVDFFIKDYIEYSNGKLDQIALINVDKEKTNDWNSREIKQIRSENVYDIANLIALQDWSYSDDAVVAVVDYDIEDSDYNVDEKITGTLDFNKDIIEQRFETQKLNLLNPRFHEFEVPEGYKYLKSRTWWPSLYLSSGKTSDLPAFLNVTIPAADPDSQIYCRYNDEWMMVAATSEWNLHGMDLETAGSYVYRSGPWKLGITDVPTKGKFVGIYGDFRDFLKNVFGQTTFYTDISIYPGFEYKIPIKPVKGCKDASFNLTWNQDNIVLGLTLIGPSGEEILTSMENQNYQEIKLDRIGECLEDENYYVSIFTKSEVSSDIDFELDYSWHQEYPDKEIESLSSATEGAVLASQLNAPMLYVSSDKINDKTKEVLYKLGVENIHIVDLGNNLKNNVKERIKEIGKIKNDYNTAEEIYDAIVELSDNKDIIISTIDPWTKWLIAEQKPYEETNAGLFIGPAAYCAAHHGSPVLLVENHPELSSATIWHTEFWSRNGGGIERPNIAAMYLTGMRAYDLFDKLNFDIDGQETMITIAGQYDIGASWDRAFTGKAKSGRIFGSPVDTSYWISHNMFYPGLIFNNPAMDSNGVKMVQGSSSKRSNLFPWGSTGLKITQEQEELKFNYPVLLSYVCYEHYLNDRLEKYLGFRYKTADDIIPGVTESFNPIDEGISKYSEGAIWPDMATTEVTPAYLSKGGFGNVFSTKYETIVDNLNNGVLLWLSSTHGAGKDSGKLMTWDTEESLLASLPNVISNRFGFTKEENPWRGYDWYLGSTEEPDTMTMESHGFIAALLGNPNIDGFIPTGLDFWPSERPILHFLSNLPIIKWFMPNWLKDDTYYKDGMVIASMFGGWATNPKCTGYNLDEDLENLHSCGFMTSACLPAYKYLHLTMIRHGSPFQIIDPWKTSWYSAFWGSTVPRDIILGDTVGEAYVKGISHVGILYITDPPQWWWDVSENVCFFGDPDQRMFVPDTTYSSANYWTREETMPLNYDIETNIEGHMPYGATSYPHKKDPKSIFEQYLPFILIALIVLIAFAGYVYYKKKK